MKIANISETKNQLSAMLKLVKKGERMSILDRNRVIAWIIPPETSDANDELSQLERQGIVTRATTDCSAVLMKGFAVTLPENTSVLDALLKNRDEER